MFRNALLKQHITYHAIGIDNKINGQSGVLVNYKKCASLIYCTGKRIAYNLSIDIVCLRTEYFYFFTICLSLTKTFYLHSVPTSKCHLSTSTNNLSAFTCYLPTPVDNLSSFTCIYPLLEAKQFTSNYYNLC